MHTVLIGKNGQVGYALARRLENTDSHFTALGSADLDISDPHALRETLQQLKPDLLINAAAYTAVDRAEQEADLAFAVNAQAPAVMAETLQATGGVLVHYSTDYVFDGCSQRPYRETDTPNPQSVYGSSKLQGEQAIQASGVSHLILRTSWVYGERGHNFYRTMQRLLGERDEIGVVDDQVGAPTWCEDIATATLSILQQQGGAQWWREHSGLYHMTNAGQTSWYGFACAIAEAMQAQGIKTARVKPITTAEYPTPAQRPAYSVLDNRRLLQTFAVQLPDWRHFFAEKHGEPV